LIASPEVEGRGVAGVDRVKLIRSLLVNDLHDGEIIVAIACGIRDLEDFAVRTRLLVQPLDLRP
jgi:hypothetical protein